MTFGEKGKEGSRVHDLKEVEAILDVFQRHGHSEVGSTPCFKILEPLRLPVLSLLQIDTALAYTGGTSEKYLGEVF